MVLDALQSGLASDIGEISAFVSENPIGVAVGTGLIGAGIGASAGAIIGRSIKKKTKSNKRKSRKTTKRKRNSHRKQKKPYTAGKRKDRSHKRIRYTKNNQPYIILASGKARFIKKSSAKRSKKLKGGRY
jgi:uncharacterized membrane protein YhiD involved in acid resistance